MAKPATSKQVSPGAPRKSAKPAASNSKKAVVHSSKTSFKGKVFTVTTDKVTEPGGVTGIRDVVRHNGSIVILAVDSSKNPADPLILIERQYRYAAGRFLLELPAGTIDVGETPLAAAKRELIEETGFRAGKWSKLVHSYASPGFLAETMQIYLAEDLKAGIAKPEPDERIELLHIPLSELLALIEAGQILDGKTIIGTLYYARFRLTESK